MKEEVTSYLIDTASQVRLDSPQENKGSYLLTVWLFVTFPGGEL